MKFWSLSGSLENWEIGISGTIWGVRGGLKSKWEKLSIGDILIFYSTSPVSGVIGIGKVENKLVGKEPLWADEIKENKIIYPYRFEFKVLYALAQPSWKEKKIPIAGLRIGFQAGLNPVKEEAAMALFKKTDSLWGTKFTETIGKIGKPKIKEKPKSLHEELKEKIKEIGEMEGFISEKEYPMDGQRLDVVWRAPGVVKGVPKYVFEIEIAGGLYRALAKLKHAFDLWAFPKLFLIAQDKDRGKVMNLLSGTFHEIRDKVKIVKPEKVDKLYKVKKEDLETKLEFGLV